MNENNEKKINVKFVNDESIDDSMYLWRYMDLHKFLSFILTKSLHLTRLDKFEDIREGMTSKHLYFKRIKNVLDNDPIFDNIRNLMTIDTLGSKMNLIEKELKEIQRFNFASCWVLCEDFYESVAMWNLYSNPNSIAIKIKYNDFKKRILETGFDNLSHQGEIICGPIKYKNFQKNNEIFNPGQRNNLNESVFIKDISFEHEKEFRIILREKVREIPPIQYKDNISNIHIEKLYNDTYNYSGVKLKIKNLNDFPFEIIHHPKSEVWAKNNIKEILEKFNINYKVKDSKLELK